MNMKKIIALLLAFVMLCGVLSACVRINGVYTIAVLVHALSF